MNTSALLGFLFLAINASTFVNAQNIGLNNPRTGAFPALGYVNPSTTSSFGNGYSYGSGSVTSFRGGGEGLQYGQVVQSTPLGSYQTYSYGTNGLSPFSQFGGGQVQGNAYGGQFGGGAFGLSQPSGFIFPVSVCFVF